MDLTVAGAYMQVTNKALAKNAQTSVLEYKTKLGEKTLGIIDKQIEDYKKLNKKLEAEHERLVAEGEELKAQGERNSQFRDNIQLYEDNKKDISNEVSPRYVQIKNRRTAKTYHVRAEVCERIKETVKRVNLTIHKSAKETINILQGSRPITNMLLNKENKSKILDNIIFRG